MPTQMYPYTYTKKINLDGKVILGENETWLWLLILGNNSVDKYCIFGRLPRVIYIGNADFLGGGGNSIMEVYWLGSIPS